MKTLAAFPRRIYSELPVEVHMIGQSTGWGGAERLIGQCAGGGGPELLIGQRARYGYAIYCILCKGRDNAYNAG